jgi:hypothetical protein
MNHERDLNAAERTMLDHVARFPLTHEPVTIVGKTYVGLIVVLNPPL